MRIKLNGKRLYPTDSVKYLGVKNDSKLNLKSHVNAISINLNRTNTMLCKVRDFAYANIFNSIYYALFESHINCASTICRPFDEGGRGGGGRGQGGHSLPLFLKSYFARYVFLEIRICDILHSILKCFGPDTARTLSEALIWEQNNSTINRLYIFLKKSLGLSILKSVMLNPLLCFITLKLSKLQIKSRLRTVSS